MNSEIERIYGNKVRVRVCGLCWQNGRLLLVNHSHLASANFWAPPGGGLEFGESATETLRKEFLEETGLLISPGPFLFACEFISKPLHAIELFFKVALEGGALTVGGDPEMDIIEDVRFISPEAIAQLPARELHGIFNLVETAEDLETLNGFFTI